MSDTLTGQGLPNRIFEKLHDDQAFDSGVCDAHGCEFSHHEKDTEPYGERNVNRDTWSCDCQDGRICPRVRDIIETAMGMCRQ